MNKKVQLQLYISNIPVVDMLEYIQFMILNLFDPKFNLFQKLYHNIIEKNLLNNLASQTSWKKMENNLDKVGWYLIVIDSDSQYSYYNESNTNLTQTSTNY